VTFQCIAELYVVIFRPVIVISGSMSAHQENTGAFQELNQV